MSEESISVGPDMGSVSPVGFTREYLEHTYKRIELIEEHFAACCAFQMDRCHFGEEYDSLYERINAAGMPEWKTPCSRSVFDEWLDRSFDPFSRIRP